MPETNIIKKFIFICKDIAHAEHPLDQTKEWIYSAKFRHQGRKLLKYYNKYGKFPENFK
jgi:hypothetical protein